MKIRPHHPLPAFGFTIIELLVATAVIALLSVLLLQMIGMSSAVISSSTKKLDGLLGAQFALDQIGRDIAARIRNPQMSESLKPDEMSIASAVDTTTAGSRAAWIGYRVSTTSQLERGLAALDWSATLPQNAPAWSALQADVLAEGVLRVELAYIKKDGTFVVSPSLTDFSDVAAIVVAVAVLDPESRKALTDTDIAAIAPALGNATAPNLTANWEANLAASGLHSKAKQSVRFFQRTYVL